MKELVFKDLSYLGGSFTIKNVPHYKRPTGSGRYFDYSRDFAVEVDLSRIFEHMEQSGIEEMDYSDWENKGD